jgi:hypothetical protein
MRYGIFNNKKVLTSVPFIAKGNNYIPVLLNGNWQDVREDKLSFDAAKLALLD